MLLYGLIGLSLVLLGVAGLQFMYLFYINRIYNERRKYLQHLERRCASLTQRTRDLETRVREVDALLAAANLETGEDTWADVIEER